MEVIKKLIDLVLHLDKHLDTMVQTLGPWLYVILFLIVFCETGLVVTPFLPGDSLLFAVGALTARPDNLNLGIILISLLVAAILGDTVNYWAGRYIGPKAFREGRRFLNINHLRKTEAFYERYGGKTIIIARFVPIVRTFAPFVAGIGHMKYSTFMSFNVIGAFVWIFSLTLAGYFFGNLPLVKNNFTLVIFGIIIVSILPAVIEFFRERSRLKKA
ncbi:MAG: DedA family protein [Verrucomicrobiales bacterium]